SSSRSASTGLKTTSPANQDMPCPPPSGTGRDPVTPKAASTAGGGNGTDRTYPTQPHRAATTSEAASCRGHRWMTLSIPGVMPASTGYDRLSGEGYYRNAYDFRSARDLLLQARRPIWVRRGGAVRA